MTTEKTVETLQEEHTEMLATAYDIGLEVPDELKANFTDAGAGAGILAALDALIREHQGKEEAVLANDGEEEHTGEVEEASSGEQEVTAPPKKPRKSKPKAKKATAKKAEATAASGETEVAIVKAKTTKTPKKAAAKKAPGKKASASARTKVTGTPRIKYEDNQKIVKLGENPSDPKSGRGQRIANVLKHSGKTYKTYRASGGKDGTLNWCVKAGIAKVA